MTISGTATDPLLNSNTDIVGQTVTVDIVNAANTVVATSNGTVQSNGTWSVNLTAAQAQGLGDGIYTVTANVSDASGNPATLASQTVTVDTVTPTAAVTVGSSDVNLAAHTALVTFTFSEATSDFTLADTTAVGGALSHLATTDGGLTYTATFTANANTDISNGSVSVTAGTWHEANGNPGTGATSTAFVVDTVTPTAAVTVGSTTSTSPPTPRS